MFHVKGEKINLATKIQKRLILVILDWNLNKILSYLKLAPWNLLKCKVLC